MLTIGDIVWGGFLPAAIAAAVFASVWWLTGRPASSWRTGLVAGYVAGHWALAAQNVGWLAAILKSYHPTEARDWLPLIVVLSVLPDTTAYVGKWGAAVGWVMRVALCAAIPWRFLYGSKYIPLMVLPDFGFESDDWSTGERYAWLGGTAALLMAVWLLLRYAQPQGTTHTRTALAVLVALAGAVTMALSASITYGQLFGIVTAAVAGGGLASALLKTERSPDAGAGPLAVLVCSVVLLGYFYAELTGLNAVLLLVALVVATGWMPLPAAWPAVRQSLLRGAVCMALLIVCVSLAVRDFQAKQPAESTNPYSVYQQ